MTEPPPPPLPPPFLHTDHPPPPEAFAPSMSQDIYASQYAPPPAPLTNYENHPEYQPNYSEAPPSAPDSPPPPPPPQSEYSQPPPTHIPQSPYASAQILRQATPQPPSSAPSSSAVLKPPPGAQAAISAPLPSQVNFSNNSEVVTCTFCNEKTNTVVKTNIHTAFNWICTLCLCLPCFFLVPATSVHVHSCALCGATLGSNNMV